ncbi:hypothetical protein QN277_010020 [Acacia crassicarpa]|uniref:Uncharacterized protein n=1 Tax=Acacia crassicarpa TaxID=499986 RepID=A0AAE1IQH3_9FABA|nr:hypothetical protein QN277_010020 [Acacia crassicarpa]
MLGPLSQEQGRRLLRDSLHHQVIGSQIHRKPSPLPPQGRHHHHLLRDSQEVTSLGNPLPSGPPMELATLSWNPFCFLVWLPVLLSISFSDGF